MNNLIAAFALGFFVGIGLEKKLKGRLTRAIVDKLVRIIGR